MDAKQYLHDVQAIDVDDASAKQYEAMVSTLNRQLLEAAESRLEFSDEPAHYLRLLRQARGNDG